jgi:hypothetical protein
MTGNRGLDFRRSKEIDALIQINRLLETRPNVTYADVVAFLGDEGAWVLSMPLLRAQLVAMFPESRARLDA